MSDLVIETTALRKEYRHRGRSVAAVRDLDLAVARGTVHGLLGPNGAGKTTTLRLITGLARPTSGRIRLLGEDVPARLPQVLPRVGAVVDQPRFSTSATGLRSLSLLAHGIGESPARVERVVAQVGMAGREHDSYRTYSPAVRMRLAIAAALLKSPEVLLLDEPTTGLDPAGSRGVRDLIRDLGRSGTTVLVSSHLLAEVQQVCDHVTVLEDGRRVSTGPVDTLVGRDAGGGVRVAVADPAVALQHLREAGMTVTLDGDSLYVEDVADPARITELLAAQGMFVRELSPDLSSREASA